jgi:hypothetical protein
LGEQCHACPFCHERILWINTTAWASAKLIELPRLDI